MEMAVILQHGARVDRGHEAEEADRREGSEGTLATGDLGLYLPKGSLSLNLCGLGRHWEFPLEERLDSSYI